jgi:hypothetical protein
VTIAVVDNEIETDGVAPADGDALVGCALPPAHALAGEQAAHVPCAPAQ